MIIKHAKHEIYSILFYMLLIYKYNVTSLMGACAHEASCPF